MSLFLITRPENFWSWSRYSSLPSKQKALTLYPCNVGCIINYITLISIQCTVPRIVQKDTHYVRYCTLMIRVTAFRRLGSQHLLSERHRKLTISIICCKIWFLSLNQTGETTVSFLYKEIGPPWWYCFVTGGGIRILISVYRFNP